MLEAIERHRHEKTKEKEQINNTIVKCEYDNVSIRYGDAITTLDETTCFEDNGQKITLGRGLTQIYFCSEKCISDWERGVCRRFGYRFEK
jgi:hypothetical protein